MTKTSSQPPVEKTTAVNSRVFFVSRSERFDVRPAMQYGPIVYLEPIHSVFAPDKFCSDIRRGLLDLGYNPDTDYIALTGPAIELALFTAAVFETFPGTNIYMLIYNSRQNEYSVRALSLGKAVS